MNSKAGTVAGLIDVATARLSAALDLERREARLEAQILASRALGVNRAWLIAHDQEIPDPAQSTAVEELVARRERGEPVAYILGEKEFYGHLFRVTPDVLIPRPETELLVEAALERLPKDRPAKVLDLGTGSGCIAITLALERPEALVTAIDRMPEALDIARENARRLGANVEFLSSRWFSELEQRRFDLIVGNPPYVASNDPHLVQGDVRHEPSSALSSGAEGLDDLIEIVSEAPAHLRPEGWLLLEHGYDQAGSVRCMFHRGGLWQIRVWPDLAGLPRVSGARLSE